MTKRRKRWRAAIALVVIAAVAGGVVLWQRHSDGSETNVDAVFANAGPLATGNLVKAHGVRVGTVAAVRLDQGRARVTMTLDRGVLPLHADAHVTIRPVSLLGERYLDLEPGTAAAPVLSQPATIPVDQTSESVDLDQILNTLDDPTSTALAALVTTLGEGLQGNGNNTAEALKALAPALQHTDQLVGILNQQNAVLDNLIDSASPAVAALADGNGSSLDKLASTARQTLSTVAANRDALDSALRALPSTLDKARRTLADLTGAANATTPALDSIRPVTDNLSAISDELRKFSDAATPALTALQPVLDKANALLDQAAPVVDTLKTGTPDLRTAAGELNPLGTRLLDNVGNLIDFATGWAMATSGYDSISHYFRANVNIDPDTLKMLAPDLVPGVAATGGTPAPPTGQPAPPAVPLLGQLPLPLSPAKDPGNATGLTQQQEQSMLNQLLGGVI